MLVQTSKQLYHQHTDIKNWLYFMYFSFNKNTDVDSHKLSNKIKISKKKCIWDSRFPTIFCELIHLRTPLRTKFNNKNHWWTAVFIRFSPVYLFAISKTVICSLLIESIKQFTKELKSVSRTSKICVTSNGVDKSNMYK